jgi:hypothetical protein
VNSASTTESFSVSFGPRCAKKKYAPAAIRTATTAPPTITHRRAIAAGPLASGTVVAETFVAGTFEAELGAAETLADEIGAAETEPLAAVAATGTPALTLLALAGGTDAAEMARVLMGVC